MERPALGEPMPWNGLRSGRRGRWVAAYPCLEETSETRERRRRRDRPCWVLEHHEPAVLVSFGDFRRSEQRQDHRGGREAWAKLLQRPGQLVRRIRRRREHGEEGDHRVELTLLEHRAEAGAHQPAT